MNQARRTIRRRPLPPGAVRPLLEYPAGVATSGAEAVRPRVVCVENVCEFSSFRRADLAIRHDPRAVSLHLENRPFGVRGVAMARGFKSSLFQRLHLVIRYDSGAVSFRFENRSPGLGLAWHSPICLPFRRSTSRIAKLERGAAS